MIYVPSEQSLFPPKLEEWRASKVLKKADLYSLCHVIVKQFKYLSYHECRSNYDGDRVLLYATKVFSLSLP